MSAPRVWDLIMLGTETDMLECRLREFEATDCLHVVVESQATHRGTPKPLHYAENKERFGPWSDRIIHVVADRIPLAGPPCPTCGRGVPWITEHAQRDAGWAAVEDQVRDSDVVLIADVDEFPSAEALEGTFPVAALSQRLAMYAVDWLTPTNHICSVVASGRYMRGKFRSGPGRPVPATTPAGRGLAHHVARRGLKASRRRWPRVATSKCAPMRWRESPAGICYQTGLHVHMPVTCNCSPLTWMRRGLRRSPSGKSRRRGIGREVTRERPARHSVHDL